MGKLTTSEYNALIEQIFSKNFTQQSIADYMEVSKSAVSKWKSLENTMDGPNLLKLTKFVGITLSFSTNAK